MHDDSGDGGLRRVFAAVLLVLLGCRRALLLMAEKTELSFLIGAGRVEVVSDDDEEDTGRVARYNSFDSQAAASVEAPDATDAWRNGQSAPRVHFPLA